MPFAHLKVSAMTASPMTAPPMLSRVGPTAVMAVTTSAIFFSPVALRIYPRHTMRNTIRSPKATAHNRAIFAAMISASATDRGGITVGCSTHACTSQVCVCSFHEVQARTFTMRYALAVEVPPSGSSLRPLIFRLPISSRVKLRGSMV